ncbi:hypothetical protein SAMN02745824_0416 [Parasphingorhabdus marina DSM 22363]|uniref:CAAX prenyl protease 2/Lysostaphin resistance protein A-like domain-containing protein n=1 Tax=Parasphingorhabdus marina DSM 22363 TaxID=1123272 RepID=A0A1N6CMP4_9SPHN|nr:CPBP family intramembrane glutamic endopeptidase [Parasphingorhabdus marina]SIN59878.1 hypothetical protein SAMN02745824_0416 [Parasphingorhabdus marina DSM 22363]
MTSDLFLTMLIWWVPILLIVGLLKAAGKVDLSPVWLLASIGIYAAYAMMVFSGIKIPGVENMFVDQRYNWSGKILAISTSIILLVALIRTSPKLTFADAGVTWKQNAGSIGPALVVTALMIGFIIGLQLLVNDGTNLNAETLIYQATIPGLDEELMFRGLLLLTLSLAVTGQTWTIKGATVHWGAIVATLFFAWGHSVFIVDGAVQADVVAMVITGLLGAALMWIRLRTGSIVMPIIAHNATNFANQFF